MSSTTPSTQRPPSRSRAQTPPPRPTTPLRAPSRSSLRSSHTPLDRTTSTAPLDALEAPISELADSMADLEANFVHLQLMHESLSRFTECFAAFLYGLNVNAFCVDFPEAPVPESFRRAPAPSPPGDPAVFGAPVDDPDQTFLTTDTSFVENPPVSAPKREAGAGVGRAPVTPRGRRVPAGGRGGRVSVAASTTAAAVGRGVQSARGRSSGLARASGRARGSVR